MPSGKPLTDEQKRLIAKLDEQGLTYEQIAGQMRLRPRTILYVLRRMRKGEQQI